MLWLDFSALVSVLFGLRNILDPFSVDRLRFLSRSMRSECPVCQEDPKPQSFLAEQSRSKAGLKAIEGL